MLSLQTHLSHQIDFETGLGGTNSPEINSMKTITTILATGALIACAGCQDFKTSSKQAGNDISNMGKGIAGAPGAVGDEFKEQGDSFGFKVGPDSDE